MTIGFCTNRKFLTLQVTKHEFTPVLPDFLIKCTKPHTRCRTIVSCGKSKFQLSFPMRYNRAGAVSLQIYLSYSLQKASDWFLRYAIPTLCILSICNAFCNNKQIVYRI